MWDRTPPDPPKSQYYPSMSDEQKLEQVRQIVRDNIMAWYYDHDARRGPCWPLCHILANAGWGTIYFCKTKRFRNKRWYGHFVLKTKKRVIDVSGEWIDHPTIKPEYRHFERANGKTHESYDLSDELFWLELLAPVIY